MTGGVETKSDRVTWIREPSAQSACTVIAEVAQAHDGSLGMAHAFIETAARAGAHAVKFQTHIAAAESTQGEPWRVKFSRQDATRYDYWKRMEFTPEQWAGLKEHAEEKEIVFLSSPFSREAVSLLRQIGIAAWKVASGELTNLDMISDMARDGKPVLLSTGMSPLQEVDRSVDIVRQANVPFAVFQCTTQYPSPPEAIGLNVLDEFRSRYGSAVGLSDHSGTIYPSLAAVAAHRAQVVEVHLTMSREAFGPDVPASLTPAELKQLCEGIRFVEGMRASPVDKSKVGDTVSAMRSIFFKSVVALDDFAAGTILSRDNLGIKKPGTGIAAAEIDQVVGRKLKRAVKRDVPLQREDLE